MPKNPKLGTRYTCFRCGTKFYDLNRPVAACPECGADQAEAPTVNSKVRLGRKSRAKAKAKAATEEPAGNDEDLESTDDPAKDPLDVLGNADEEDDEEDDDE